MSTEKSFALTFLGTCACEISRRLKDECKDRFDNDARRTSAMLMNGHYLIDCGMHILDSLRIAGKPTNEITDIFVTHLHIDHFDPEKLAQIAASRSEPLRIWVREDAKIPEIPNVTVMRMAQFQKYDVGEGLSVIGMPANHDQKVFPQHFIFEREGKRFFYGCDGGWLLNQTYCYMKNAELDLIILDCTVGDYVGDFRLGEHNSIPMIRLMLPSLRTVKAIKDDTRIILSHLALSLHKSHAETVEIASGFGAEVAFDGKTVDL
ncbi:MAG: MBL fold metallo-hydrolase [Clostridia bacterium]|nr:MBL fold metallo-hydrolase [Clostridia bacterium]